MAEQFSRRINIYVDSGQAQVAYDKLVEKQNKLTADVKKYADAGKEVPQKLTKQLNEVNAALDRQQKKLSGELSPSMKELTTTYGKLNAELARMSKQDAGFAKKLADTQEAKKALDDYRMSLSTVKQGLQDSAADASAVPFFGKFGQTVSDLSGRLPTLGAAFKALWAIVAANPIIALGAALMGLFQLFKRNAEVADQVQFIMAGLGKVLDIVIDNVVEFTKVFGEKFMQALKNPGKLIKELGDLIKENLINRFKGFGELFAAIADGDLKKAGNALVQIGTGVTDFSDKVNTATQKLSKFGQTVADAARQGYEAAKALDELVVAQGKLGLEIAKNNNEIAKQETIYKDATRGTLERIAAIDKLIALEKRNAQIKVQLAQQEYDAELLKARGRTLSAEEEKKLFDLQAALVQARTEQEDNTRKAVNKRADLVKEIADKEVEAKKKANEEMAKLGKQNLERQQKEINDSLAAIDNGFTQIKAQLITAKNEQGATEEQYRSAQLQLDVQHKQARLKYLQEYATGSAENDKAILQAKKELSDAELAYHKNTLDEKTAASEAQAQAEMKMKEKASALAKAKMEEDNKLILAAAQTAANIMSSIMQIMNQNDAYELAKDRKKNDEKVKNLKRQLDGKRITQRQYDREIQALQERQEAREREIVRKQFKRNQAIQIVQAVINTASAIMSAFATSGNIYAGIVLAALAAATGAAQIAVIASAKPPEFGDGGEVNGPSHRDGGVNINAEGGEFMVKNGPSQRYRPLLERINSEPRSLNVNRAKSNLSFALGGAVGEPAARKPRIATNLSDGGGGNDDTIRQELAEMRKAISNLKVTFVKYDYEKFEENQTIVYKRAGI